MSSLYHMPMFAAPGSVDMHMRDRLLVVALVVLVHVSLLWSWISLPRLSRPVHHEMSVSMAVPSPPQAAAVEPEPAPRPATKPKPVVPQQPAPLAAAAPAETPAAPQPAVANTAPAQPVEAAPGLPDREPDYQAAYLHNPPPVYPMAARRMGWQGRVVLNVEVLSSGLPGQIRLYQSSGHEVLDNAALQAVRGWRFAAARQGGQIVSKWFLVPIPFILKEAE